MKKLIFLLVFVFTGVLAYAHPPVINSVVYDSATKILTISFTHDVTKSPVADTKKHFIKEVDVSYDNNKVIAQIFDDQETPQTEVVLYKALLDPGDMIKIDASCSLKGSVTTNITIK